jgi:hypothetical protein
MLRTPARLSSRYDNCYPHRETLIRRSLLLLERKFIEVL